MDIKMPKSKRRMLIVINLICLVLLVLIFELIKSGFFTQKHLILEIAPIAILAPTYNYLEKPDYGNLLINHMIN